MLCDEEVCDGMRRYVMVCGMGGGVYNVSFRQWMILR